jgi:hypothetical protein
MRAKSIALAIAVIAAGLTTMPAAAHQGHASCAAYGAAVSGNAQSNRPWGQTISQGAQLGLTSALVAEAHTIEGLCEPR